MTLAKERMRGAMVQARRAMAASARVAGAAVLAGVVAGCSPPQEEICRLVRTDRFSGPPDPLVSAYRWAGDRLIEISRARLDMPLERVRYEYDELGRLTRETLDRDVPIAVDPFHLRDEIEYAYDPASPEVSGPRTATHWQQQDDEPRYLQERAVFTYASGVLRGIAYDNARKHVSDTTFEYGGDGDRCATRLTAARVDGALLVMELAYDDRPSPGSREFGDRFYMTPSPPSSVCERAVARLAVQRFDELGRLVEDLDLALAYEYGADRLPAHVEYQAYDHVAVDFAYECAPAPE